MKHGKKIMTWNISGDVQGKVQVGGIFNESEVVEGERLNEFIE